MVKYNLQVYTTGHLSGNAPVAYSIVSGNIDNAFGIDSEGKITTMQELDREIESQYSLGITANGSYKQSPETKVYIRGEYKIVWIHICISA